MEDTLDGIFFIKGVLSGECQRNVRPGIKDLRVITAIVI